EDALEETAERCRRLGGRASVVPTDFASITEGSLEDHRRVVETNLFGPIYGARAVVPHFRERGRGVLINVSSILGKTGQPFVPSYVISKFGLRGPCGRSSRTSQRSTSARVRGHRGPQVSTPRFALWAAGELAKIEAGDARRWWTRSR